MGHEHWEFLIFVYLYFCLWMALPFELRCRISLAGM
jgi:hypothetical protein